MEVSDKGKQPEYEQQQRVAELRIICNEALNAYEAVLYGNDDAIGSLLDAVKLLVDAGITPNLHVIKSDDPEAESKQQKLVASSVLKAEWLCGQLLKNIQGNNILHTLSPAVLEEHDEFLGEGAEEGAIGFNTQTAPQSLVAFAAQQHLTRWLRNLWDKV